VVLFVVRGGGPAGGQLLQAAGRMAAEHQAGAEKAAALITSVFLHGTENRQGETAGRRATRRHTAKTQQPRRRQTPGQDAGLVIRRQPLMSGLSLRKRSGHRRVTHRR
jgi:hypothetical protein